MHVQAARADLRRGKSRGTRTKDQRHAPPRYTGDTPGGAGSNHVRCRGTLWPGHELQGAA